MNSKKSKNKNRSHKPPNPNPPQKTDPVLTEKVEDVPVQEKLEHIESVEERVPEIISDIALPVLESESKDDDSPKKPKRNRGKKNKQDKEEANIQPDQLNKQEDVKIENPVVLEEIILELPSVIPSARKKKNKNKKTVEPDHKDSEKSEELVTDFTKEEVKSDDAEPQVKEIATAIPPESITEHEVKNKKKNKKRKNRTDSERSEKAEDTSCITDFQKLTIDEKSESRPEIVTTPVKCAIDVAKDTGNNIIPKISKDEKIKEPLNQDKDNVEDVPTQSTIESTNKNKKKNKKEKKTPAKELEEAPDSNKEIECKSFEDFIVLKSEPTDIVIKSENILKENIPEPLIVENIMICEEKSKHPITKKKNEKKNSAKDNKDPEHINKEVENKHLEDFIILKSEPTDIIIKSENILQENIPDTSLEEKVTISEEHSKVKPMIAKPVEKKRKGKTQDQSKDVGTVENKEEVQMKHTPPKCETKVEEQIIEEKTTDDLKFIKDLKVELDKPKETLKTKDKIETHTACSGMSHIKEDVKTMISVPPPASEMGKKRKKSPKPIKQDEISKNKPDDQHKMTDSQIGPEETANILPVTPDIKTPDKEEIQISDVEKEIKPVEKTLETPTVDVTELKQKDDKVLDPKNKKKRKKSPKLPTESDKIKETEEVIKEEPKLKIDSTKDKKAEGSKEKADVLLDTIEDIEIASLKTDESEGSTCGATPDIIQYPRAISQDLMDTNNNTTVVQEITVSDEATLQVPIDIPFTPLIQCSGETPLTTPEVIIFENIASDRDFKKEKPKEPEKTDLKSKMMEVNQDMEELRLSIERSLAELTAIEKSEDEVERKFAEQVLQTTKGTDVTPSMSSKIVTEAETGCTQVDQSQVTGKETEVKKEKSEAIQACEKSVLTLEPNKEIRVENFQPLETILFGEQIASMETGLDCTTPPVCPSRKDHKNKGKNKKKGKHEADAVAPTQGVSGTTERASEAGKEEKEKDKKKDTEQNTQSVQEKGKQQSSAVTEDDKNMDTEQMSQQPMGDFEPIESFEDAMTSSADDINKTFEMIANDANQIEASHVNPEINITAPIEDTRPEKRDEKINPVSQPKNLLGHPDIPAPSNRIDYKKEKNKSPNETLAKVKIKDAIHVDSKRESKESQTDNIRKFMKNKTIDESFALVTNENEDFVYKYSFRKVYMQNACHVCKKDLKQSRVPCTYCDLVFYCNGKHKDEDWPQHQALCFAVSTIVHLKDQKHIYADSKDITGQNYRLLRMQMIVSCEKVLKRRLVAWEQEALLYPRVCADISCREWRQGKLTDCDGCGQISYCIDYPDHYPKIHQRWCKSYLLYSKLVCYQQTKGRLEPKMPSKVMLNYQIPGKMNEVLASMYEEKIDMNDIQYAALTQIATAPLTAAYCYQTYTNHSTYTNGTCKKSTCTVHVVGAELQFEADALNKWEVFFLHIFPGVTELRVVLIAFDLNPSKLPLDLLSKVKMCDNCRLNNRRVVFNFQDKKSYHEYCSSDEYIQPNIVCAFNASINRASMYNSKDPWPKTINCVLKQRVPFLITSYTLNEIHRDLYRVKECADHKFKVLIEPDTNSFASVRPDRNFISDDEMPLLFKNYCYLLVCGV